MRQVASSRVSSAFQVSGNSPFDCPEVLEAVQVSAAGGFDDVFGPQREAIAIRSIMLDQFLRG